MPWQCVVCSRVRQFRFCSDCRRYKPARHTTTGWLTYKDSTTIYDIISIYTLQGISSSQSVLSRASLKATHPHYMLGRSRSPTMLNSHTWYVVGTRKEFTTSSFRDGFSYDIVSRFAIAILIIIIIASS